MTSVAKDSQPLQAMVAGYSFFANELPNFGSDLSEEQILEKF